MKDNNEYKIEPHICYTPLSLAVAMQASEEWVKDNLIYSKQCRFKKKGRCYFIMGRWVIEWVESEHNLPPED